MKRYYLSTIIGNGDGDAPEPWTESIGSFRPAVAEHPVACVPAMPQQDPETGALLGTWCLVMARGEDHSMLLADPRIAALPDVSLDIKVAAIGNDARAAMVALLNSRGLPSSLVTSADSFGDVVTAIGRHLNPVFDLATFDAA